MNFPLRTSLAIVAALSILGSAHHVAAQYAAQVLDYYAGTNPASGYTTAAAALGAPESYTGESIFPGVVSPFNPPFGLDEIVSIGEGGQITLRLSNYAIPQAGGPEIGVFTNAGIADEGYPNGLAGDPPFTFGVDDAEVWVSEDGLAWSSLGTVTFDIPTNGYADAATPYDGAPGSDLADFQQPFTGGLSSFDGLKNYDAGATDILDVLAGSGTVSAPSAACDTDTASSSKFSVVPLFESLPTANRR
jgi:hypothetical protein